MADPYGDFSSPVQPTPAPQQPAVQQPDPYASFSSPVGQKHSLFGDKVSNQSMSDLVTGQHQSKLSNIPDAMSGMFWSTVDNGTIMQPARWVAEHLDVGGALPKLKAKYPGMSDEWYQQQAHKAYGNAVTNLRQQDQAKVDNNPYPGHIVGNTAVGAIASIPANPELMLVPGAGLEAGALKQGVKAAAPKVAAYAANNAARFGAANAVSDAAAQLMDMAEGQQKDFDVTRSLHAAGMGAALGGGHALIHSAGASPVVQGAPIPDFVKNLFVQRGVDTTPMDTPQARTAALTGERMQFSPEEQGQLKQLLRTGSVDDIKQFFQGKNGPQPTWTQVNQLVEMRDGGRGSIPVPDRTRTNQDQRAKFAQAMDQSITDNHRQLVSDHIGALTKDWKNSPDVEVVNHVNDIQDPEVRQTAINDGVSHENTVGFVGTDGKVRVFAPQVKTPEAVSAVLYHEALGHYGLAQRFGTGLDKVLQTLDARNVGQFKSAIDKWQAENPGAYGGDRTRAAEEVLAEASQNGPLKKSWADAVVSHVRRFGRQMGLKLSYSDAEVNHILAMAHDAVINGKPGAAANRFGMSRNVQGDHTKWANFSGDDSGNRMMYVGKQADVKKPGLWSHITGDGKEWFVGPDGKSRLEISDHDAELKDWDSIMPGKSIDIKGENPSHKLGDVLDHPALYKAYPELKNLTVTKNPAFMDFWGSTQGWFDPKTGVLNVSPHAQDPRSTMLHEIQHWVQRKEDFSFGGNTNSIRLDNKDALNKLESFYTRRLDEAHAVRDRAEDVGDMNAAGHQIKALHDRLYTLADLEKDRPALTDAYNEAEHLDNKHKDAILEAKRISDKFEDEHQQKLQAYHDRQAKFNDVIDKLREEERAARANKDYKRSIELNNMMSDMYRARNIKSDEYPRLDYDTRREAMSAAFEKADQYRKQRDAVLKNIEGIKGKYSNLSHDLYKLIAGEREARDVQARQHMHPDERKDVAPYTHEGILDSEVIHTTADDVGGSHEQLPPGEQAGKEADETVRNLRWGETPQDRLIKAQRTLAIHGGEHPEARHIADEAAAELGYPSPEHATVPQEPVETMGDHFWDVRPHDLPEYPGKLVHGDEQLSKIKAIREGVAQQEAEGNRFMTPQQLNRQIVDGTYEVHQMERAYNATDRDYVPTTRSWAQVKQDALQSGFSPSAVKKQGHLPDLQKRVFQTQAAAKVLDARISGILDKWDTPELTQGDRDNLRQALVDHAYILGKLRNERADMARALNISKLGYTRAQMESFGEILRESGTTLSPLGDDDTLNRFARQLKNLSATGNHAGMNSMVGSLNKAHWEDYLTTLHMNMMLSGLSTHVKAPLDMAIGIGRELLDNAGALPLSVGREALRALGINVKQGVHPTETAARLWGVLKAALDADTYRNTASTFVNGGINPNGFGINQRARIPVVSKVTDLISAQDAFFRAFSTNMHLYGLGTRQALEEARANGTPKDWDTIMAQGSNYARNPSPELLKEARNLADQTLLLNKNALTQPLDNIKRTGSAPDASALARAGAFVANFLTPFVRVESNSLMNRIIRRSPLAFLDPQTIKDLKAGGPQADIAISRVAMGTASIAAYWMAAGQGKTTGEGPDSPQKRAVLEATGWRPNAVHENGQYNTGNKLGVSVNPFDIHNDTASIVADLREAYEKGANQGQVATGLKLAVLSTMKRLADASYISDIAPAVNAITAPNATLGDKVGQFLGDQASTMVPNLFAQAARVSDQGQPMTQVSGDISQTVKNSVMAGIPGQRQQLPKRIDPLGGEVQSGATMFGQHTWLPQTNNRFEAGNHVDETHDAAKAEIGRLNEMYQENIVSPVQRTISVDGQKVKLTNTQLSNYQRMAGTEIVERLKDQMSTPEWQQMSDDEKASWIREMQKQAKSEVRGYLYGGQ